MKTCCMILASALAAAIRAAVPLAWEARPGQPAPVTFDRYHGETLALAATLRGFGGEPFADGADVRLWYQTNGMGAAWWSAPATVRSNVVEAVWSPELDPGAERVSLFFGAPSNAYAAAVLRLRHSPGFAPASLPLPVPVLDFAGVELRNLISLTNGWSFGASIDLSDATNYTDEVALDFEEGRRTSHNADYSTFSYIATWLGDTDTSYTAQDLINESTNAAVAVLSPIEQDIADLRTESALVYRLYSGSNVVVEVTNYNSQVHAPALRLMQLNESNEYVTVWTETNGLARTLAKANEYTDAAITNRAAPRAWSRVTSGLGEEAPSNTTWISTEKLVIASGQEYVSVDSAGVWVLCANGQVDFTTKTNSYFSISTETGEPVFSVERSDSRPIPVYSGGIRVDDSGGSVVVTIPVPVFDATENRNDPPFLSVSTDLSGPWYSETNSIPSSLVTSCTWSGQNGAWTNTVVMAPSHPVAFFSYAKWQAGGMVIRNKASMEVSQGIIVNGQKFVPVINGSTLTWQAQ